MRKKIHSYIQYAILLLIVFALPLPRKFLPPLLIFLSLNWLIEFLTDTLLSGIYLLQKSEKKVFGKFQTLKQNRLIIALLLYITLFLCYVVGFFYSEDIAFAKEDLILKLPLFAFPVILFTSSREQWSQKLIKILFQTFLLGCTLAIFLSLYNSYENFLITSSLSEFYYVFGSHFHHPSYASMYYCLAIGVMGYYIFNKKIHWAEAVIYSVLTVLFVGEIFLLLSRTAYIVLAFIFISFLFYIIFNKKIDKKFLLVIGLIGVLVVGTAYYLFPKVEELKRFNIKDKEIMQFLENDNRFYIWRTALEAIDENMPWGVGTGDVKNVLADKFEERGMTYFSNRKYNCHSQYLQLILTLGIPGITLFLLGLFYAVWVSIKKKYFLYALFILIIAINFFTESMLEREAGVMFFAFFNAFLCLVAGIGTNKKNADAKLY